MLLRINKLSKEFGKNNTYQKVLDNINVEFKSGEFVCILGESGSGKSTLLNILGGLDNEYSGTINIDNVNLKYCDLDDYRKNNIGFIFQNFNLINDLSVLDNILILTDKFKIGYKEKRKKALNLLRKLNIYNIKNKKINELSGGQKQRIAIARALINDPKIILADEPTGALDEKNGENILEILKKINLEGKLVIVVTHSNKVINYSTRVITIKDGKISSDKKIKRVKETRLDNDYIEEKKYLYLIKYGLRSIINNKKRNLFITLASSIGIIGIILSFFIGNSVKNYMKELILSKVDPLIYNISKSENNIYQVYNYTSEDIDKISNIKYVEDVIEGISYNISSISNENDKYDLTFLDSYNEIDIEKGNKNGLIISNQLYKEIKDKNILGKKYLLSIIDNYKIIEREIEISGISKDSGFGILDDTIHAYISYDLLKEIYKENNLDLKPTSLKIKIKNDYNVDYVKKKLKELGFECSNNNELYEELNGYLNIAVFILSMFSSLSLIVSVIMISIIINITILERTKEIGLLRSIGYSKSNIRDIFNSEAICLGLLIGLFSIFISKIIINVIENIIKNKFDIVLYSSRFKYYFLGLILSVSISLIASYFPSKKASKQDPIKSLRYE